MTSMDIMLLRIFIVGMVLHWVIRLPDTLDQLRRWPAMLGQVPAELVVAIAFCLALIVIGAAILFSAWVAIDWLWRWITGKAHNSQKETT